MAWFKVDDGFWCHPKSIGISANAAGVWVLAGAWCAQNLTDGAITTDQLRCVCPMATRTAAASELVRRGLWEATPTGWQFVDWEQWQPTKAQVEARREAEAEKKRRQRRGGDGRFKLATVPQVSRGDK